jgi:hypothetical protein
MNHLKFEVSCPSCRLPQIRLIEVGNIDLCAPCAIAEINLGDIDSLCTVLPFIHEHRICAYCGEYGTDIEHVVPRQSHLPTWTVRACSECNGLASGKVFPSFADKRHFIRKRIRRKYARRLQMPEWTADEIAVLGYRLAQYIQDSADSRDWIHQRLTFDINVQEIIEAKIARYGESTRSSPMSSLRKNVPGSSGGPEVLQPEMPHGGVAEGSIEGSHDPSSLVATQPR